MALLLNVGDTVSRSYSYTQPSPLHPIQPSECGERTGNLFDKNANIIWHNNVILNDNGNETSSNSSGYTNPFIEVESNTTYTLNGELTQYGIGTAGGYRVYYYQDSTFLSRSSVMNNRDKTFTTPQNCNRIALQCQIINNYPHLDTVMLNLGSEPLTYEPWGYKIPILNNSQTTNVYLGEVQTTRKIQKQVFTGNELWVKSNNKVYINNFGVVNQSPLVCTHFPNEQDTGIWNGNSWVFQVDITQHGMSTRDEWIAYLKQQYTAGTPVTVWYVLAAPTTGIVNEPLRKIGTYADEVSGITIPVAAGANTLSIGTTVQPSEVTATYKGWHPVADVHERESGQWD